MSDSAQSGLENRERKPLRQNQESISRLQKSMNTILETLGVLKNSESVDPGTVQVIESAIDDLKDSSLSNILFSEEELQ